MKQEPAVSCRRVMRLAEKALEAQLAPQEIRQMQQHLHCCPACSSAWETMQKAETALRTAARRLPASAGLAEGFAARLAASVPPHRRAVRWQRAAALALTAAGLLLLLPHAALYRKTPAPAKQSALAYKPPTSAPARMQMAYAGQISKPAPASRLSAAAHSIIIRPPNTHRKMPTKPVQALLRPSPARAAAHAPAAKRAAPHAVRIAAALPNTAEASFMQAALPPAELASLEKTVSLHVVDPGRRLNAQLQISSAKGDTTVTLNTTP